MANGSDCNPDICEFESHFPLQFEGDSMLDIKEIRKNPDKFKQGLINRGNDPSVIDVVLEKDKNLRELKKTLDDLRHQQKEFSKWFYNENIKVAK